jgi:formate dehydrogenase major subunit/formate dehydrogenase alpha subunit
MGIAPGEGGMDTGKIMRAVAVGKLRALFVMGADPLGSPRPEDEGISGVLDKLELMVVLDPVMSKTAERATVVLPTFFAFENEGTFTNYKGRVQKVNKAVNGPGGCRADWDALGELSKRMGVQVLYGSGAEVMEEIAREIPAYGAVSYAALGDEGLQL